MSAPSPITASTGDNVSTITVTVRDAFGNAVSGATVTLSATGTGNTLTPSGTTDADGHMIGTLSSTVAGTKTITATGGNVSMAIGNDPTVLGAHLGGTTLVAAIAGVATFSDLTIDQLGLGYTLRATADGMTAESEPFTVLTLTVP